MNDANAIRTVVRVARSAIVAALLATGGIAAARMTPEPTGLWLDPAEAGWGLSLSLQGETVFGVLFAYDDARRPAWYVASSMLGSPLPGPGTFSTSDAGGPLLRMSGPWFGSPFDPAMVSGTPVGQIHVAYIDAQTLAVVYSIDGQQVVKTLRRFTWSSNRPLIAGSYVGGLFLPKHDTACGAPNVNGDGRGSTLDAGPNAQLDGIRISWSTGIDTVCLVEGGYSQHGQFGALTSTLLCGPVNSVSPVGTLQVDNLQVSESGFSGNATLARDACIYRGYFGGVATR